MEKRLQSGYVIRFSDCDLFGHLNNARYIDYFLNAREDHLKTYYDMDLQSFYKQGLSWFVASHEIMYLRPAQYNERVIIHSALLHADNDLLWVEMQMTDEKETHLKSLMWTKFVPVNIKTGRKEIHPPSFMDFAHQVVVNDIDLQAGLKERIKTVQLAARVA
jgi:YbgC/YbaW family acyl-CoA thioester hydrolase